MVLRRDHETTCDVTKYTFITAIHRSIGNVIQRVTIALVESLGWRPSSIIYANCDVHHVVINDVVIDAAMTQSRPAAAETVRRSVARQQLEPADD